MAEHAYRATDVAVPLTVPRIPTKDRNGNANGTLLPIANKYEATGPFAFGRAVEQVYVTTIRARMTKGPHLHLRRSGFFTPLVGKVAFIVRRPDGMHIVHEVDAAEPRTVHVPPGWPSAMVNRGDGEALVLNVVEPAWRVEDPDDEPVQHFDLDLLVRLAGRPA